MFHFRVAGFSGFPVVYGEPGDVRSTLDLIDVVVAVGVVIFLFYLALM